MWKNVEKGRGIMFKVLVLDDDQKLCKAIQKFNRDTFEVDYITDVDLITSEYVSREIKREMYNLIIFDLEIGEINGLELYKELKPLEGISVIFLSGNSTSEIRVKSLLSGADDFIQKPIDLLELQVKMEKMLEAKKPQMMERIDDYVLDNENQKIYKSGEEQPLPPMALKLLKFLLRNQNQDFTRDELIRQLWNYEEDGGSRIIDININTIRSVTRDSNIITVRGIGYKYEKTR